MELGIGCQRMLQRLYRQRRIGGKHIPEGICKQWIKNLSKQERKKALEKWKWCIQEGLVLTKQKPSERHVFLNPTKVNEIKQLIKQEEENYEE